MFTKCKRSIRMQVDKLKYLYAIRKYKLPRSCKVIPSKSIGNLKCEGYNIIAEDVTAFNCEIGFASGIGKKSVLYNTKIGRYTVMATGLSIVVGTHPTKIFATVHPAFYSLLEQYGFTYVKKQKFDEIPLADAEGHNVVIGNDVWVGANVSIIGGTTIGDGAIIAAGAVVTKDVPPYAIVGGVPAQIIRYRYSGEQIENLLKLKWWNKDEEWIRKHAEYFEDIEYLLDVCKEEIE